MLRLREPCSRVWNERHLHLLHTALTISPCSRRCFRSRKPKRQELLSPLLNLGLQIVTDARGPVPLLTFGRLSLDRLELTRPGRVPLPDFVHALKRLISEMDHEKLRVLSPTEMVGVGYVFNTADPETWPVRTSQ